MTTGTWPSPVIPLSVVVASDNTSSVVVVGDVDFGCSTRHVNRNRPHRLMSTPPSLKSTTFRASTAGPCSAGTSSAAAPASAGSPSSVSEGSENILDGFRCGCSTTSGGVSIPRRCHAPRLKPQHFSSTTSDSGACTFFLSSSPVMTCLPVGENKTHRRFRLKCATRSATADGSV